MRRQELEKIKANYEGRFKNKESDIQVFIATRNIDVISPESIDEYIARGGYFQLERCVNNLKREDVINEISLSGLRGRGGAGFPTGKKWSLTLASESADKYFICNGDEGDPGAFMDRAIIEGDPHSIIEAMCIGGYAIGASNGIVYIRAEYPLACKRIEKAIIDARGKGILGKNIFGSAFCFDIQIKKGAGAFVCGEETALIKSCEGLRGEPIKKPPYPAVRGYFGKPTCINNVETLACVPYILQKGWKWFASIGTEGSKGTKVFALTGKVKNAGLYELPMGSTIRDLVFSAGGGMLNDKPFKAVQMGGPSGGCVPAEFLDTKIDYESLKSLGAMMGSGGMIVMDTDTCMVDIAKFFLNFSVDESCGKCTPCRLGNRRLYEILDKICDGKGEPKDLEELEQLAKFVSQNSLCGLGQNSPNPILSTLRYFRDEYITHITDKKCLAGVCKSLKTYSIDKSKCVGCSLCSRQCPVEAIKGQIKQPFTIQQDICIKCGRCAEVCPVSAVKRS